LVARVSQGTRVVEYVYPLTEEPADRRDQYDLSVMAVALFCFRCDAAEHWERVLHWEHDG
jgi:hypothetical protein